MATKVHYKSYPMRDLNENSSSSSWSPFYGDKNIRNGQCYNLFMPRNLADSYAVYDKDALKQKMLEHEELFKNQVHELHRLYVIQRNMMEEVKSKEVSRRASIEASSSSSFQQGSQVPSEDAWKWHTSGFPLSNTGYGSASNSPISYTKGSNPQAGRFPYQNGFTSTDSCALDSRPLKVRKKLFDLQLPADEYTDDTEEGKKLHEHKVIDELNNDPNINPKCEPEISAKNNCRIDASASASCLRNSVGLADLNEPFQVEEAMAPSSVGFLGHFSTNGVTKGINRPVESNACHLGVNEEIKYVHDGFLKNSSIGNDVTEKKYLTHIYEAGSGKSNLSSTVPQHLQQDKLSVRSQTVQVMVNPVHHPLGIFPTGFSRKEPWRERGLEFSDRSRDYSNNRNLEPVFSSSHTASSFAHSVSSWAKPTSSFTQNLQSSAHSQQNFGGTWQVSASNVALGNKITERNGFYQGSASRHKERHTHLSSAGFDRLNCSRIDNVVASDCSNSYGFRNYHHKGSLHADSKSPININLNEALISQDLDGNDKSDNHLSALPWLKPKSETIGDLNQLHTPNVISASSDCENVTRKKIDENQNVPKILRIPIFETRDLKDEQLSCAFTSASIDCPHEEQKVRSEMKKRIIDINLECEPDEEIATEELTVEKEKETDGTRIIRDYIDLNSCISDWEDSSRHSNENKSTFVKITLEIGLEAPVLLESEDDDNAHSKESLPDIVPSLQPLENKIDQSQDEVLLNAAETIFAISSYCPQMLNDDSVCFLPESPLPESLLLFVDVVFELESNKCGSQEMCISEEIDEFEVMTLQIEETKEKDYMPIPFVPEFLKEDETVANTVPTRSRRGQSRRGRQRRDFQRDILPGMVSLSRHEVTEDLQIFGGLMRATGHSWDSGLTRRNGRGRGRRRAVVETETVVSTVPTAVCTTPLVHQQVNVIEEDRSLTGWGKTTRRPRRQRCPAGNPPTFVLTS